MTLLLDQNLSRRLLEVVGALFPVSTHVAALGLSSASDIDIWRLARARDYAIVSKDGDFHQLSLLHGSPPKIIWLRVGNASTDAVAILIAAHAEEIGSFLADDVASLLVLGPSTP